MMVIGTYAEGMAMTPGIWGLTVCRAGLAALLLAAAWVPGVDPPPGQTTPAPFGPPFAGPPGPGAWFVAQWYGNTVWAHRNPYPAGQGLHFGVDFNAPCGTPVVAIGDGVVFAVDGPYGAAPHSVVIAHPDGLYSLYGHLLERAPLTPGQPVRRGDPLARSGEPASRCDADPHLHLEIRRAEMRETVNPVPLIALDWQRATLGIRRTELAFERDLDAPERWTTIADQPDVTFGGPRLNGFPNAWP
jgi:murein DD-endopeptidase MepM/ murein hydrolase activator NlpD